MHQSYAAICDAEYMLQGNLLLLSGSWDGLAASPSGRGLKLRDLRHRKTSLQLLPFVEGSAWSACSQGGAVSWHIFKRLPIQTQNINAMVFSSGDWQLQTPRWHAILPAACGKLFWCSQLAWQQSRGWPAAPDDSVKSWSCYCSGRSRSVL